MRFIATPILLILTTMGGLASAQSKNDQSFISDSNVQKVAEAYALDAVDLAKKQFGITLDWTDASITNTEKALAALHISYKTTNPKPSDKIVAAFAKGFGSYIGEVYRRNHGAEWGLITFDGQTLPGLKTNRETYFWPWDRASKRITQGAENNVADYYKTMLGKVP
ncbi:MAG: hypothetical protein QM715_06420 [Nibricoccus sp.]